MPRLARQLTDDSCYHVITRGNNRAAVFHEPADYQRYGQLLLEYLLPNRVQLYHYCLMTNHVHLVVRAATGAGLRQAMQGLNLRYALAYKRKYAHTGHFWQDRFKSLLIAEDAYLLQCGAYVDLNPVRARLVHQPQVYPWSSARVYTDGVNDPLVVPNPSYLALGSSNPERQTRYQQFLSDQLQQPIQDDIATGSTAHLRQLASFTGTSLPMKRRGRPSKEATMLTS
ncbi:MAG: transposase [Candidatus Omnitrophica bacterium]|nr:transposase [Candidatus Omnitrophota bacterium]MBI3010473.1 transposase [Candidatus Omnitrophota bacterium]